MLTQCPFSWPCIYYVQNVMKPLFNDFEFPSIKKHKGFVIDNYQIILEGNCISCQENKFIFL